MLLKKIKLAVIAFFIITNHTTVQADQNTCAPSNLNKLYTNVINSLCYINHVMTLTRLMPPLDNRSENAMVCALLLTGVGIASITAHTAALISKDTLREPQIIKNSQQTRDYYLKSIEKLERDAKYNAEYFKNREILEKLTQNKSNHLIAAPGQVASFKKGPNKYLYGAVSASSKMTATLALAAFGGATTVLAEAFFNATTPGCSDAIDLHIHRDPSSNCKVDTRLSPEVIDFLNLSEKEQAKILKEHPSLCESYESIATNIEKDLNKRYALTSQSWTCVGGAYVGNFEFENSQKSEVRLGGDKATMYVNGSVYKVEYTKDQDGQRVLKSIVGEDKITESGVYSPAYQYNFPMRSNHVEDKRFQKAVAEVSRQTLALQQLEAFDKCQSHAPSGATGEGSGKR